eukprot:TRINITY_DN17097_c0_g1_i1.p1 TRINITY_DN17097_c0_g1~~TRINITY_DN17097_c0_g1_i1.p1  ORF type:complete len:1557 (+),score=367.41 TRINITY_DN17097_c0_g1_i1:66-4736(+)
MQCVWVVQGEDVLRYQEGTPLEAIQGDVGRDRAIVEVGTGFHVNGKAEKGIYKVVTGDEGDMCRICRGDETTGSLVRPCACSGSIAFTHRKCTVAWALRQGKVDCELCRKTFALRKMYSTTAPSLSGLRAPHVFWNLLRASLARISSTAAVYFYYALSCGILLPYVVYLMWRLSLTDLITSTSHLALPTTPLEALFQVLEGGLVLPIAALLVCCKVAWDSWLNDNWVSVTAIKALKENLLEAEERLHVMNLQVATDKSLSCDATVSAALSLVAAAYPHDRRSVTGIVRDKQVVAAVLHHIGQDDMVETLCNVAQVKVLEDDGDIATIQVDDQTLKVPCVLLSDVVEVELTPDQHSIDKLPLELVRVDEGSAVTSETIEAVAQVLQDKQQRGEVVIEPDGTVKQHVSQTGDEVSEAVAFFNTHLHPVPLAMHLFYIVFLPLNAGRLIELALFEGHKQGTPLLPSPWWQVNRLSSFWVFLLGYVAVHLVAVQVLAVVGLGFSDVIADKTFFPMRVRHCAAAVSVCLRSMLFYSKSKLLVWWVALQAFVDVVALPIVSGFILVVLTNQQLVLGASTSVTIPIHPPETFTSPNTSLPSEVFGLPGSDVLNVHSEAVLPSALQEMPEWAQVVEEFVHELCLLRSADMDLNWFSVWAFGGGFLWFTGLDVLVLASSVRSRALEQIFWFLPVAAWADNPIKWAVNTTALKQILFWFVSVGVVWAYAVAVIRTPLKVASAVCPWMFPLRLVHLDPARFAADLFFLNICLIASDKVKLATVFTNGVTKVLTSLVDHLLLRSFIFGNTDDVPPQPYNTYVVQDGVIVYLPPQLHLRTFTLIVSTWITKTAAAVVLISVPLILGSVSLYVKSDACALDCLLVGACIAAFIPYMLWHLYEVMNKEAPDDVLDAFKVLLLLRRPLPRQERFPEPPQQPEQAQIAPPEDEQPEIQAAETEQLGNNRDETEEGKDTLTSDKATESVGSNDNGAVLTEKEMKNEESEGCKEVEKENKTDSVSEEKEISMKEEVIPSGDVIPAGEIVPAVADEYEPPVSAVSTPATTPSTLALTPPTAALLRSPSVASSHVSTASAKTTPQTTPKDAALGGRKPSAVSSTSSKTKGSPLPLKKMVSSSSSTSSSSSVGMPPVQLKKGDEVIALKKIEFASGKYISPGAKGLVRKVPGSQPGTVATVKMCGILFSATKEEVKLAQPVNQDYLKDVPPDVKVADLKILPPNIFALVKQATEQEKDEPLVKGEGSVSKAIAGLIFLLFKAEIFEITRDRNGIVRELKLAGRSEGTELTQYEREILILLKLILGKFTGLINEEETSERNSLDLYCHVLTQVVKLQEAQRKADENKRKWATLTYVQKVCMLVCNVISAVYPSVVLLVHWVVLIFVFGMLLPLMTGVLMEHASTSVKADQCPKVQLFPTYVVGLVYFELWIRATITNPNFFSYPWKKHWVKLREDGMRGADAYEAVRYLGVPSFTFLATMLGVPYTIHNIVLPVLAVDHEWASHLHHHRAVHAISLAFVVGCKAGKLFISTFRPMLGDLCQATYDERYLMGLWLEEFTS